MDKNILRNLKGYHNNLNQVELLDKVDVLSRLHQCLEHTINDNYGFYQYITKEIFITRKSFAKLYLFDNKKKHVYALPKDLYNKTLRLLDLGLDLYY